MSIKITCINKANGHHYDAHESISHLGWINENTQKSGRSTLLQIVEFIEKGDQAYTLDKYGNKAYLIVKTSVLGNKYVKTVADGTEMSATRLFPR